MTQQLPRYNLKASQLQAAIIASLKTVLPIPIYDYVPEGTNLPYVAIGTMSVVPYRLKIIAAVDVGVQIDVWSAYTGFAETESVLDLIVSQLTGTTLQVQDSSVVDVIWDSCNITIEASDTEIIRHGQVLIKWRLS